MAESTVPHLRLLRTERSLTQAQLAEVLGVTSRTVLRWEAGDGEPSASELMRMARFFGVGIDLLVSSLLGADKQIRVATLSGRHLDHWVAKGRGLPVELVNGEPMILGERPASAYSTDWAAAGPLIEEHKIHLQHLPDEGGPWLARCSGHPHAFTGVSAPEAAMRAFVATKFGSRIVG